jgi:hypothetical protein
MFHTSRFSVFAQAVLGETTRRAPVLVFEQAVMVVVGAVAALTR